MTCGRTQSMESLARGELSFHAQVELRAHAQTCTLCRHELRWLETEAGLFRQRAGRDEVSELWKGVEQRSTRSKESRSQLMMALAAMFFAVVSLGWALNSEPTHTIRDFGSVALSDAVNESEPLATESQPEDERCSKLPTGLGFHCGPVVPASFVATR